MCGRLHGHSALQDSNIESSSLVNNFETPLNQPRDWSAESSADSITSSHGTPNMTLMSQEVMVNLRGKENSENTVVLQSLAAQGGLFGEAFEVMPGLFATFPLGGGTDLVPDENCSVTVPTQWQAGPHPHGHHSAISPKSSHTWAQVATDYRDGSKVSRLPVFAVEGVGTAIADPSATTNSERKRTEQRTLVP